MLDRDIAAILDPGSQEAADFDLTRLSELRATMIQIGAELPAPDVETTTHSAGTVRLRLYRPVRRADAELPVLLFLHGGGWILGDLDTHDAPCRLLSHRANCAVVAVEYRLAPEHPFPAALDDCLQAFEWIHATAHAHGCDRDRIALGGESAGANLAAALAVLLRDRDRPRPAFQFLVHPATDLSLSQPSIDAVSLPGMTRSYLEECVRAYAAGREVSDPLISPLRCGDLSGLPPAVIYTVEVDPLRDDGESYALALARAGNDVSVRRLAGLPHGFMFLPVSIGAVDRAFDLLAERLATDLRKP